MGVNGIPKKQKRHCEHVHRAWARRDHVICYCRRVVLRSAQLQAPWQAHLLTKVEAVETISAQDSSRRNTLRNTGVTFPQATDSGRRTYALETVLEYTIGVNEGCTK